MVEVLKDESVHKNARSLAGILFKNTVLNTTKDEEWEEVWNKMTNDKKDVLKQGLLESLASIEKDVIRAAGSSISALCLMEIPHDNWLEIIDILCTNVDHEDTKVRYASLLTLGYIWEELLAKEIQKPQVDLIVSAFLGSFENNYEDEGLIIQAIQGVYHALKFTYDHFQQNQGKVIMDKVIACTSFSNSEVRVIAMQCIVEAVRLYYDYIEEFMPEITEVTFEAAKKDVTEVKTQAIEVWSSIAEEEGLRNFKGQRHHSIIDRGFDELEKII